MFYVSQTMPIMQTHKSNSYENFTNLAIILKSTHMVSHGDETEISGPAHPGGRGLRPAGCGRLGYGPWAGVCTERSWKEPSEAAALALPPRSGQRAPREPALLTTTRLPVTCVFGKGNSRRLGLPCGL